MATRPTKTRTFLIVASVLAKQGTCSRRKVGVVLTNKHGHIIGSGYNGVAFGLPHCIDSNCSGSSFISGEGLSECEAIHAEQNALMQCSDIHSIESVYCTTSPCAHCIKMLMNTSAKHIYFIEEYEGCAKSEKLWLSSGLNRTWTMYKKNKEKLDILIESLRTIYDMSQTPWTNPWMVARIRSEIDRALASIGEKIEDE